MRAGSHFALALHVFEDVLLERFKADGPVFADRRGVVAGAEKVRVTDDEQRATGFGGHGAYGR